MIRIVKMTFREEKIPAFLQKFEQIKYKIRGFEGVEHLSLLRDKHHTNVFFTYSIWRSEADLENYRTSDFFKSFWTDLKPYFADKTLAWSTDTVETLA